MKKFNQQEMQRLSKETRELLGCGKISLSQDKSLNVRFTIEGSLSMTGGLLSTLVALRDLFGAADVDIPSHYHVDGCPTCDAGSYDVFSFVILAEAKKGTGGKI